MRYGDDGQKISTIIKNYEKEITELKVALGTAIKYLKEGKKKFAKHTTNSLVDDFLEKWEEKWK